MGITMQGQESDNRALIHLDEQTIGTIKKLLAIYAKAVREKADVNNSNTEE